MIFSYKMLYFRYTITNDKKENKHGKQMDRCWQQVKRNKE